MSKRRKEKVEAAIDWATVLGPVLSAGSTSPGSLAVQFDELADLQQATFAHVRRAVRPRPRLAAVDLPFATDSVPWFPRGRFVAETPAAAAVRPGAFMHYAAGDYYIQDAGSMLAVALMDARPGDWVCDTCAAPGGKSSGLLEQLAGSGVLVANEVIRSRLSLLALALERTGYGNQMLTNLEVEQLSQLCGPVFDRVLVDAPCTGQTMVGRGKQRLAAFSAAQIAHSSARQQRILRAAARLVKPGGRLVYSTCAYSFAENEQVVLEFARELEGWQLAKQPGFEAWASPLAAGCYRVWPHRHGCSGAFAAVLVNAAAEQAHDDSAQVGLRLSALRTRFGWRELESLPQGLEGLVSLEAGCLWQGGNQIHRFDTALPADWIGAAVAGTELACRSGEAHNQRWSPSFGAAVLSGQGRNSGNGDSGNGDFDSGDSGDGVVLPVRGMLDVCELPLDDGQAIRFVAGESLRGVEGVSDAGTAERGGEGWCVPSWRGRRLAWGKLTGGVLKNHFPKAIRQPNAVCQ